MCVNPKMQAMSLPLLQNDSTQLNNPLQVIILNKSGIPLYYRSNSTENGEDYFWMSGFVSAMSYFSKTIQDQVTEIILTHIKYLFYEQSKYVIVLGIPVDSENKPWKRYIRILAKRFNERFDSVLDEIGRYHGKLNIFNTFSTDYAETLRYAEN